MSELRTRDITGMQDTQTALLPDTCSLYRSPAASSGKVVDKALLASGVACERSPLDPQSPMASAPDGMAGGRVTHTILFAYGQDVIEGDEARFSDLTVRIRHVTEDRTAVRAYGEEVRA